MCLAKDIVAILRPAKSQQFARTALLIFANCMTLEVVTNVLMTSSLRHLSCMNMFKERLDLYAEDSVVRLGLCFEPPTSSNEGLQQLQMGLWLTTDTGSMQQ